MEISDYIKLIRCFGLRNFIKIDLKKKKDPTNDNLHKINKYSLNNPVHITFVSHYLPRFDRKSSDLRIYEILKILISQHTIIDFIYIQKTLYDKKYLKPYAGKINFVNIPLAPEKLENAIKSITPDFIWITSLWRIDYFITIRDLIARLRNDNFASRIIVDTMDFHFKEFQRKYETTRNNEDLATANQFLENEGILYRLADLVIVISDEEKRDIAHKIDGIKDIKILPNIHPVNSNPIPYSGRKHICFVGNFGNKHNVDAVLFFINDIFPAILKRNPQVEFHLIGNKAERLKNVANSPNTKIIGFVKNIEKFHDYYKLFVCPMKYGAGMKGKIGMAAATGLPVVTTTIGAEGFPVKDGEELFIADDPVEFAEKCNQCLNDPHLWRNFQIRSLQMISENLGPDIISRKLSQIVND